jgi:hypothetical protein
LFIVGLAVGAGTSSFGCFFIEFVGGWTHGCLLGKLPVYIGALFTFPGMFLLTRFNWEALPGMLHFFLLTIILQALLGGLVFVAVGYARKKITTGLKIRPTRQERGAKRVVRPWLIGLGIGSITGILGLSLGEAGEPLLIPGRSLVHVVFYSCSICFCMCRDDELSYPAFLFISQVLVAVLIFVVIVRFSRLPMYRDLKGKSDVGPNDTVHGKNK